MYRLIIQADSEPLRAFIQRGTPGTFGQWLTTRARAVDPMTASEEYLDRTTRVRGRIPDMAESEVVQRALELWFEELKAGAENPKEKQKSAKETT